MNSGITFAVHVFVVSSIEITTTISPSCIMFQLHFSWWLKNMDPLPAIRSGGYHPVVNAQAIQTKYCSRWRLDVGYC